jgi:hypothetical protein
MNTPAAFKDGLTQRSLKFEKKIDKSCNGIVTLIQNIAFKEFS